jgi:cell division septation protein DedD
MAVAAAGMLNDPMLLRVPPASIRALGEYGQTLAKRGVAYNMVVTKVAFDMDAESPKLTFKPVGFLDDAAYAEVQETVESDIVNNILGASFNAVEAAPAAEDTEVAEEAPAPATKPTPVAKPKPVPVEEPAQEPEPEPVAPVAKTKPAAKATPKPAPKPAPVEDDFDLDLDGISFDD